MNFFLPLNEAKNTEIGIKYNFGQQNHILNFQLEFQYQVTNLIIN